MKIDGHISKSGMSVYDATGEIIIFLGQIKWLGFGMRDDETDGAPQIPVGRYEEGMTVKVPGAEKELQYIERELRRLNERCVERICRLGEGTCLRCGKDRGRATRFCLDCQEMMS